MFSLERRAIVLAIVFLVLAIAVSIAYTLYKDLYERTIENHMEYRSLNPLEAGGDLYSRVVGTEYSVSQLESSLPYSVLNISTRGYSVGNGLSSTMYSRNHPIVDKTYSVGGSLASTLYSTTRDVVAMKDMDVGGAISATLYSSFRSLVNHSIGKTDGLSSTLYSGSYIVSRYNGPVFNGVLASSFYTAVYSLANYPVEAKFSIKVIVEPSNSIYNNRVFAGRWYVIRLYCKHSLGVNSIKRYSILFYSNGVVIANVTCSTSGCLASGVGEPRIIYSIYEDGYGVQVLAINTSIPWSVGGEAQVIGYGVDFLYSVVKDTISYYIVNTTKAIVENIRDKYWTNTTLWLKGKILYSGTNIPVYKENVSVYIANTSIVKNITVYNGTLRVALRTPLREGNYTLVIDPEHGDPTLYTLNVVELPPYGGKPIKYKTVMYIAVTIIAFTITIIAYKVVSRIRKKNT